MQQLCLHGVYRRSPLSHRTSAFEWNLRLGPDMTPKTTGAPRAQNTNLMSRWSGEMEHFNQEGLDFMAPSTAQYFKVCETSFQHHTELKSRFILNALGYRNKLLDSYVQRNHIQVCNRREWACLLERQREGGRDVEAGRQMIFLGGGDYSGGLFICLTFHSDMFPSSRWQDEHATAHCWIRTRRHCVSNLWWGIQTSKFFLYHYYYFFLIFGVYFLKNLNLAHILKQTKKKTRCWEIK